MSGCIAADVPALPPFLADLAALGSPLYLEVPHGVTALLEGQGFPLEAVVQLDLSASLQE